MIELSGRAFSRAWLAVQLAASDDDARPVLYRAVHIEEYPDGVRLMLDAVGDTLDSLDDDGEVAE